MVQGMLCNNALFGIRPRNDRREFSHQAEPLSMRLPTIALFLSMSPALHAAVMIPESGVQLSSLSPANTQGQFGALTQGRLANGTYANMSPNYSGFGNYFWYHAPTGGNPRIYPSGATTQTTSGPRATPNPLYAPPDPISTASSAWTPRCLPGRTASSSPARSCTSKSPARRTCRTGSPLSSTPI